MYKAKIKILSISLFAIVFTACEKEISTIIKVDNPTQKDILFKIDNNTYKVYSNHLAQYEIKSGAHILIIGRDSFDIYIDKNKKYLLNPTRSTYIIDRFDFADDNYPAAFIKAAQNHRDSTVNKDTILIKIEALGGILFPISGFLKKTDNLILEETWDYGVTKSIPKQIIVEMTEFEQNFGTGRTIVKIFSRDDYVTYIIKEACLK